MAIFTPLQGTGGMSDATINAMLQSGDPGLVQQANDYIAAREQEIKERGADKGILGAISNLFGFSKLAAAEPNMPSSQKFSNQFSVTQPSQFDFKGAQLFDPTNMMRDSVVEDIVDTPTREFGDMRIGRPDQGIYGSPAVQDLPVDFSELDDLEAQDAEAAALLELAQQEERRGALETLKAFGKDIAGRSIASQALGGAGGMIFGPVGAIVGGITGLMRGGDMFEPSQSQLAFNALTPSQQRAVGSIYGQGGIMQGYNPVSMFGKGPRGAIQDRINNIIGRKYAGKNYSKTNLAKLQNALTQVGGEDSTGGGDYSQAPGRSSAAAQEASNRDAARGRF